jgi:hypothetical protein
VPHNDTDIEYLFDVEINLLINGIAARTSDLTIVLDCCHSAGATRELADAPAQGTVRALKGRDISVVPPDLTELDKDSGAVRDRGMGGGLLQSSRPDYLVIVACQSDETASEGAYPPGQPTHGVFTYSLISMLKEIDATERARLRWTDIWPELLGRVAERNRQLNRRAQHPWIIGRSERRVFGGAWDKMDVGLRVAKRPDGDYEIGSGNLMGVTEGAEIAVYGPEPRFFPIVGTPEDHPVGRLKVKNAGPSSAVAGALGAQFVLPEGARGRLVKPGESERLRVSLKSDDSVLKDQLAESPLLEFVSATASNAEVRVIAERAGGWIVENDTEPLLAIIPAGEQQALRGGLEYYYRYNTVLRMAHSCNAPQLSNCLSVRLLDCNDLAALNALPPEIKADPNLSEAPRDQDRIYALPAGFKFGVRVANSSPYHLNVTLISCTSGGLVEYLSDALLRDGASQVMWLDNKLGEPFEAAPDKMPAASAGLAVPEFVTDRVIAIGTTRTDVDLRPLWDGMDKTVQEIVNNNLSIRRGGVRASRPKVSTAPAEFWTATVTPMRIARR